MTGVQYADHFEQHQCFSSGGDFSTNSVAYPLYEEGALGLLIRVGGGDVCGGAGYRITLLRFECDAAPPPTPRYGVQGARARLLAGTEPAPPDVWSAVYENAPPDREHLPGDGSCEYTIHLRGPYFCPVQCPRADNGLVCGGPLAGRCAAVGPVTKCWCFSGRGGAACNAADDAAPPPPPAPGDGAGEGAGAPSGVGGVRVRAPPSGRPLLLQPPWLLKDGRNDDAIVAIAVVVALNVAATAVVAALAPKDATGICKRLTEAALFAGALVAALATANAALGDQQLCMGFKAPLGF
jgi:hypothetical protein